MLPKNKVCKYFNRIHLRNSSKLKQVLDNRMCGAVTRVSQQTKWQPHHYIVSRGLDHTLTLEELVVTLCTIMFNKKNVYSPHIMYFLVYSAVRVDISEIGQANFLLERINSIL